jgi:bifunctional DNase/RNase
MEDRKVKLTIKGITNSQIQSGAFALILSDDDMRRIPIIIGTSEAQSIAVALEGIQPPRPLTHDLMVTLMTAAGISLREVYVYKFEDGVFYSEMVLTDDYREIRIDARTSDAIALALRTKTGIYTTEKIMKQCCIEFDENDGMLENDSRQFSEEVSGNDLKDVPKLKKQVQKLHKKDIEDKMRDAIEEENYELAKIYKDELIRRNE